MKQIKKLSLSNVISKLTRNEMRYVLAGTGYDDESATCPSGTAICTCNGVDKGCKTVAECWNAC